MKWKHGGKICIFVLLGVILFGRINYVLRDKTAADREAPFFEEKENSIDILLIGPSSIDVSVSPMELYKEYGYTSYSLANGGQSLAINYWCLKNALQYQNPKLVIVDISYLHMQDILAGQPARLSQFVDNIPFSMDKVACIMDLTEPEEWIDYLLNIRLYHSRWKELSEKDFKKITSISKGGAISFKKWEDTPDNPQVEKLIVLEMADKKSVMECQVSLEYIDKISALCKEQGCELLFIKVPSYATGEVNHGNGEELQRLWNGFADYAFDKELSYVNFFHEIDEIGIDFKEDFYNWGHMNYWGNLKMTHYLGKYISENYDVEDRRNDADYEDWAEAYQVYEDYIEKELKISTQEN